jgi:hypothetical protein
MDLLFLRSIALKFGYVIVAAAVAALAGWVDTNPEFGLWTMDSLKIAVITAVVAAAKKFITNFFTGGTT